MNSEGFSRTLSWILRHAAVKRGLAVSPDGYVLWDDMKDMVEFTRLNDGKPFSVEQLACVVHTNDKKRFAMKNEDGRVYVRANQGHSVEVGSKIVSDQLLTKLTKGDIANYPIVVHGTTDSAYRLIRTQGLKVMGRTHIHFAISDRLDGNDTNLSGIRSNADLLIYIDVLKAMDDGIEFYISENKVILTKGKAGTLAPKYFTQVKSVD